MIDAWFAVGLCALTLYVGSGIGYYQALKKIERTNKQKGSVK